MSMIIKNLHNKSLSQIASENNVQIVISDLSTIGEDWLISAIKKIDNGNFKYCIYISNIESIKQQKFALSYELGNFFLNKLFLDQEGIIINQKGMFNHTINSKWEIMNSKAIQFAEELLMPEQYFNELAKKYTIKKLSDIFWVPESAISHRYYILDNI